MALTLTLTYFWKNLNWLPWGVLSPVRTDPDLVFCCVTDSPAPDQCVSELGAYDGLADHEYVCRHGSVPHDVYYLVLQIAQHQISVSQNLARMMGWQIMSTCAAMGVSHMM